MAELCAAVRRLLRRAKIRKGRSSRVDCLLWSSRSVELHQRSRGGKSGNAHLLPPKGYLPIRLLEEETAMVIFVKAENLNHPLFADLLRSSAEEYSYGYTGALRLSCNAITLQRALIHATTTSGSRSSTRVTSSTDQLSTKLLQPSIF